MKNTIIFTAVISISLMAANAQKLYIKGDIIVSNHGVLFSGDSTEIDMGANSTNQVTNTDSAYWNDDLTFEIKSGTFDNFGDHRIEQSYIHSGGDYTVQYDTMTSDMGVDDRWGETIIYGTATGNIKAEKVFYMDTDDNTNTIVYYASPVRGRMLSNLLSTGRTVGENNFEWLPNMVDYRRLTSSDTIRTGISSLISVGASTTDIMNFDALHETEGVPHSDTIRVPIWKTNYLNHPNPTFNARNRYLGNASPDNNAWDGWNVIANPYTASIDLQRLFDADDNDRGDGNNNELLNATAYVYRESYKLSMDAASSTRPGNINERTYNNTTGMGPRFIRPFETFAVQSRTFDALGTNSVPDLINLHEGLLVFVNDNEATNQDSDVENPDRSSMRSFVSTQLFGNRLRSSLNLNKEQEEDKPLLDGVRLLLAQKDKNAFVDYAYVAYKKGNSKTFDYRDGRQMIFNGGTYVYTNNMEDNGNSKFPYLYNVTDQEVGQIVPIILDGKKDDIKNLYLSLKYYSTETNRPIFLEDRLKKTVAEIDPYQTIKVAVSDMGDYKNRFFLHYGKEPKIEKSVVAVGRDDFLVYRDPVVKNKVYTYVYTNQPKLSYEVYTMNGDRIRSYGQKDINKLKSKTIDGKDYKEFKITFSGRYKGLPIIVKAYNSEVSYQKIVLKK